MDSDRCSEMHLLIQADVDGELTAAEAAGVVAHMENCAECAAMQLSMLQMSKRVRQEAPRYLAPASLRATLEARTARETVNPSRRTWWRTSFGHLAAPGIGFGGGIAVAATVAFFLLRPGAMLPDIVVAAHVRALQPGHLTDVVSTDQHTVKPWFDGKLPFAPPVKDLAANGFPLAGGRLDYLPGHMVATLVYNSRQHIIDLFTWPGGAAETDPMQTSGSRDGYNYVRWHEGGMVFWAVSDLEASELATFVRDWRVR